MNRISVKQPYELLASYAIYTQTSSKPMSIEPFGSLYPEKPNQKSQTESRSETKAMHHILEWFRSFPQLFRMLATCGSLALLRTVDFAKSRTIGFILGDSVVVKAAKTHTHTHPHTHTHTRFPRRIDQRMPSCMETRGGGGTAHVCIPQQHHVMYCTCDTGALPPLSKIVIHRCITLLSLLFLFLGLFVFMLWGWWLRRNLDFGCSFRFGPGRCTTSSRSRNSGHDGPVGHMLQEGLLLEGFSE